MKLLQAFGQFAGQAAAEPTDFDLITSSTFSADSSVSIDNCFSADYQHYLITRSALSSTTTNVAARLRASASDASGTDYRRQLISGRDTSLSAARNTGSTSWSNALGETRTVAQGFVLLWISNPFDTVRTTAWANLDDEFDGAGLVGLQNQVMSHDLTTSYDGITFIPSSGTLTGTIRVYGWKV